MYKTTLLPVKDTMSKRRRVLAFKIHCSAKLIYLFVTSSSFFVCVAVLLFFRLASVVIVNFLLLLLVYVLLMHTVAAGNSLVNVH